MTTPASDGGGLDWSVAFDALPVACSVLDDRARLVRSNPAYARLFGYDSVADMAGIDALAMTHPDHRDETTEYLRALAEGEIDRHTVEKRYLRRDGSAFWGRLTATRYTDPDGALFFVGAIENIDDERRLADAEAAAERRTAKILRHVSDTVTVVDADGQVAGMTGDAENVLGYPDAWWEGRSVMDLAHPDDVDYAAELLAETLGSSGAVRNAILRAHHADGHYEWLEVTTVNLVDDPDVGGLVVTTHNVTERVRAEADLAAARDEALTRSADHSEYVAAVSHELRAPLHAILGSAELLEQADLPAEARTWTGQILREAGRLRHVVDDVLDLARLEAGRMEIHHEVFSLRDLVDEVRQLFDPTAEAKSVELTTRVEPEVEDRRTGDAHRIHQVVTNLVGNALKFTDVGRVELEVHGASDRDHVAFAVRDTGPGIPDDLRPDLFEPFVQVSPAHGRTGSGLGLAISSRLVEAMEGTPIEVSSLVGQGSSFSFSLALPLDDGSRTRDLGAASPSHPPSVRILVVDDNETNRILLEAQLTRAGYAVELAAGGAAAVERAVAEPFDVILMDWRMPDVDGLAATRRIRARELVTGAHVPIIALTASALPGDRERCLAAGMDGFLAKPVDTEGITAAIGRVLDGSGEPAGRPGPADAVDRDRVDRLRVEIGPEALRSVLQTFLDDLPNRVEAIRLAVTTRDEPALRRAAHGLRSPAGLLGAGELAESCRRIEEAEAPLEVTDLHAVAAVAGRSATGLRSAAASLVP